MKKIISTVTVVAVMGIVANAMAISTTPTTTGTTAIKATKAADNTVTGQLVAMDPTTIKVKDLKNNQEWALNVGTANVKTYKVGDKVTCTWDGTTKTLKTIEITK